MRSAWKVRFAGLPPVRFAACGSASRISSTSRALLLKGSLSRSRTTADTIRLACFSSPYWRRIRTSSPGAYVLRTSAALMPVVWSIRMSSGASCAYANPRSASSSCMEETPRSKRMPWTAGMPRPSSTSAMSA